MKERLSEWLEITKTKQPPSKKTRLQSKTQNQWDSNIAELYQKGTSKGILIWMNKTNRWPKIKVCLTTNYYHIWLD